jgi:pulcherriminic acid synthase
VSAFRTYEVYQRARPGQPSAQFRARQLYSDDALADPAAVLAPLREVEPCYRDWPGNAFWVTRYDDVTSVFTDDANYETRPRAVLAGVADRGRDLGHELEVLRCLERTADDHSESVARRLVGELADDLATEVLLRFPFELTCAALAVEPTAELARWWLTLPGATSWDPQVRRSGLVAIDALAEWAAPLLAERAAGDGDDLLSVMARLGATGDDVAVTLLELDHATVPGVLTNLWWHLLTTPGLRDEVRADHLLVKAAVLETIRHSPPVVHADRWARHEVERFGRLLPEGALVRLSAAAANRDPRVFADPDTFDVHRDDLCQREPRGQYRADGLASGISFGTGAPSKHPAVPEDRPRSNFAIARDLAVRVTSVVLDELPGLRLAPGAEPVMRSRRFGEPRMCWSLPVER